METENESKLHDNNEQETLAQFVLPHDSYWAIEERAANMLRAFVESTLVSEHLTFVAQRQESKSYDVVDGVAVLSLRGPMMKGATSFGVSTSAFRRELRAAFKDNSVYGIMLVMDSPGGTVSGTQELAQDVAHIAKSKPVCVYVEDTCCSAAYWVASQATEVYSNEMANIGSIGVYMVVDDYSKMADMKGIKTHVIGTGKYKGAGVPGSVITDEQLANWQAHVDEINEHFIGAVANGRNMSSDSVRELADGNVHLARKALGMGLIDGVKTFDQAMYDFRSRFSTRNARAEADLFVSGFQDSAPVAQTLEAALDSVLVAAGKVIERVEAVNNLRLGQNRRLSVERLEQLHALHEKLSLVIAACEGRNVSCTAKAESQPDSMARLAKVTEQAMKVINQ